MQDNDDITASPYTCVDMVEDMLCLELGIIPISLCARHEYRVKDLLASMDPEEARKVTRKWRKIKRQTSRRSECKGREAEVARWKIRLRAWVLVSP